MYDIDADPALARESAHVEGTRRCGLLLLFLKPIVLSRLLALVGLAFSAGLLADYLRPMPTFCGYDAGCDRVLFSDYGQILTVPLPLVGVLSFAGLFGLTLTPNQVWARLRGIATIAVCLAGLTLILVQVFAIGNTCPLCLIIDISAILLGFLEVGFHQFSSMESGGQRSRGAWAAAGIAAMAIPIYWGYLGPTTALPEEIAAVMVPDKVTVVEIADFQCPHCRQMHAILTKTLPAWGNQVQLVRFTAPMPKHRQAQDASRAFLCAQAQGKGDSMAEALFNADDLGPAACEKLAVSLGLVQAKFHDCVADPALDKRIKADQEWVQAASPRGLPAIWIQDQPLFGLQTSEVLQAAIRSAVLRLKHPKF